MPDDLYSPAALAVDADTIVASRSWSEWCRWWWSKSWFAAPGASSSDEPDSFSFESFTAVSRLPTALPSLRDHPARSHGLDAMPPRAFPLVPFEPRGCPAWQSSVRSLSRVSTASESPFPSPEPDEWRSLSRVPPRVPPDPRSSRPRPVPLVAPPRAVDPGLKPASAPTRELIAR